MARRKTLTDNGVKDLKPRTARYVEPDPELRGHYVRVTPAGVKSFVVVARDPIKPQNNDQVWATIGETDKLRIADAREQGREVIKRIQAGLSPSRLAAEARHICGSCKKLARATCREAGLTLSS
jgi:hypothetical protein